MAFSETTVLSTREPAYGSRVVGQVVVLPTGRIDKVALYLEPVIADPVAAQSINVIVEVYALDANSLPVGAPLASDSKVLSSFNYRGIYNFRTEAYTPTTVGVLLRAPAASGVNYVAWRFVSSSDGEPMLISEDSGSSWTKDSTRKFSFLAYSMASLPDGSSGAVDPDAQTALLQPAQEVTLEDDSEAAWDLGTLDRAMVEGDTVVVDFGDYAITMVVDQSGSMTWNDNEGLRYDFLEAFIDDIEAGLSTHPLSSAKYSIVKFYGRQIGRLSLLLQSGTSTSLPIGARLLRKQGSPITGPTDGVVLFEGIAEGYVDTTVSDGGSYYYGVFSYDSAGNYSSGLVTMVTTQDSFKYPMGAGGLTATPVIDEVALPDPLICASVPPADYYDIGRRHVALKWYDPSSSNPGVVYDGFYVVRRTDRFAESIFDGTPMKSSTYGGYQTLVPDVAPSSISKSVSGRYEFRDFYDLTSAPAEYLSPVLGLTYYYTIFTFKGDAGGACNPSNAAKASATIQLIPRFWEQEEAPLDDPSLYCIDVTPPSAPSASVIIGNEELEILWTAGDASSVRYQLYYDPKKSPELKTNTDGTTSITGTLLYDGEAKSYVHRFLENDQPHFYLLVAMDRLANVSSPVTFEARPTYIDPSTDSIPPAPPENFWTYIAGGTRVNVSWTLPLVENRSLNLWFGDTATATMVVSFSDLNSKTSLATLEFDELDRSVTPKSGLVVSEKDAIRFASVPQGGTNSLVATASMTPSLFLQNQMTQASISFRGALRVKDASTGKLYSEVLTAQASVKFSNPFEVSVSADPTQVVNRTSWKLACTLEDSPKQSIDPFPGVYVRTGESLNLEVEAKYQDSYIPSSLPVRIRILDAQTGEPSTRVSLPETNSEGVAIINVVPTTDETLDRTGNPSGTSVTRSLLAFSIPPQDFPGDFIVEVSASYNGYNVTSSEEVHFESSLNIDIEASAFTPDGVSIAEQRAFVYYGDPRSSSKSPVPDMNVLTWELIPIQSRRPRSLYSTDSVPGTGVKSYIRSGVAKQVFFGPASNVEPPISPTCTEGELWAIKCTAKIAGLEKVEYAIVELNPFDPPPLLNRIFLKSASGFNKAELMADGTAEATFVVIAKPELDGNPSDPHSGAYFRDRIVAMGGSVPSIEDGNLVTLYVTKRHGSVSPYDVLVTTNVATSGQPMTAQARIENGIAEFKLKVNASVAGACPDPPLPTEYNNLIYDEDLGWPLSPEVFAIVAMIPIEVNGKEIAFTGGGNSLTSSTPPVFLGLTEPLASGGITGS